MGLVTAATLMLTTWAAASGVGRGLEVEAGTPDDLCPGLADTEAAVRRRMGGVVGEGEGTWKARYATWYAPEALGARLLRIEIFDPAGQLQQTKDIATDGASCDSLANAIAVVVDLYFRRPDPVAMPAVDPAELPLLRVGAGASTQTGGPDVGVSIDAGVRIARRATLALGITLPRRYESQAVGAGGAELRGLPLRLGVAVALPSPARWRFEVGPEALVLVDTAETYELAQTNKSTRVVVGAGAAGAAGLVLGAWSIALTGSLVGSLPLETSKLVVVQSAQPDGEVEVLQPPRVVARVMVGLSRGFFFRRGP
jgi:hypothetical protein